MHSMAVSYNQCSWLPTDTAKSRHIYEIKLLKSVACCYRLLTHSFWSQMFIIVSGCHYHHCLFIFLILQLFSAFLWYMMWYFVAKQGDCVFLDKITPGKSADKVIFSELPCKNRLIIRWIWEGTEKRDNVILKLIIASYEDSTTVHDALHLPNPACVLYIGQHVQYTWILCTKCEFLQFWSHRRFQIHHDSKIYFNITGKHCPIKFHLSKKKKKKKKKKEKENKFQIATIPTFFNGCCLLLQQLTFFNGSIVYALHDGQASIHPLLYPRGLK